MVNKCYLQKQKQKIARWAYEYNRHGFWGKAISVPPPSINNDGSLMQWKEKENDKSAGQGTHKIS